MNELAKRKKKKGFTLVELIAVMAILAILAAVLAPKVVGYINKANETKIMEECRAVSVAVKSYNINPPATKEIKDNGITFTGTSEKISDLNNTNHPGIEDLIKTSDLKKTKTDLDIETCHKVADGTTPVDLSTMAR